MSAIADRTDRTAMTLKVLLPHDILWDRPVRKIVAEAKNGAFCLFPRHIDCVAALAPGILTARTPEGAEIFLAVDGGVLVKCGQEVLISTRHAVSGSNLETLQDAVDEQFKLADERERETRSALAQFEAIAIRRFRELGLYGRI